MVSGETLTVRAFTAAESSVIEVANNATMISYLKKNRRWIFSGIGATVVGVVLTGIVLWLNRPPPPESPMISQGGSAVEAPRVSKVSYATIFRAINNAPPGQRANASKSFEGIRVKWDVEFRDVLTQIDGSRAMFKTDDDGYVVADIDFVKFPEFRALPAGTRVQIFGRIKEVAGNYIRIDDAQFSFE